MAIYSTGQYMQALAKVIAVLSDAEALGRMGLPCLGDAGTPLQPEEQQLVDFCYYYTLLLCGTRLVSCMHYDKCLPMRFLALVGAEGDKLKSILEELQVCWDVLSQAEEAARNSQAFSGCRVCYFW